MQSTRQAIHHFEKILGTKVCGTNGCCTGPDWIPGLAARPQLNRHSKSESPQFLRNSPTPASRHPVEVCPKPMSGQGRVVMCGVRPSGAFSGSSMSQLSAETVVLHGRYRDSGRLEPIHSVLAREHSVRRFLHGCGSRSVGASLQSGLMFWLSEKKFAGSYLCLSDLRRSYLAAPYARLIRSSPSSMRKLT